MNKTLYVLIVIDDCVYQPNIVGIFETEQDAKNVIERIEQNENSELGHACLEIEKHELNAIDEELLNYNNLFI